MASTSTNKQPLLVDRVLYNVVDLSGATVEPDSVITIGGSNGAKLVVDCTSNDGAVISEVHAIARARPAGQGGAYIINLYLSTAKDFLRASQASFIGTFFAGPTTADAAVDEGTRTYWNDMPYVINPVPGVGSIDAENVVGTQFQALYIPKGKALWAAIKKKTATDTATTGPLLGVHGGFF